MVDDILLFQLIIPRIIQGYHFATNEEIKSRGIVSGTNKQKVIISSHTEKILQDNEQFLIKEKYTGHIFEVSL